MSDIVIAIGAKDEASEKFRAIGRNAAGIGTGAEEAGRKTDKAGESMTRSMGKALLAFELIKKGVRKLTDFVGEGVKAFLAEERAIDQLRIAYGGAAAGGQTLANKIDALKEAQVELSKEMVAFVLTSEGANAILERMTGNLKALAEFFSESDRQHRQMIGRQERLNELADEREELIKRVAEAEAQLGGTALTALGATLLGRRDELALGRERLAQIDEEVAKLKAEKEAANASIGARVAADNERKRARRDYSEEGKKRREEEQRRQEEEKRNVAQEIARVQDLHAAEARIAIQHVEDEEEAEERAAEKAKDLFEKNLKKLLDEAEKKKDQAVKIAEGIGGAFSSAFAAQIDQLAAGGEMDIGQAIIGALQGAVGAILTGTGLGFLAPIASSLIGLVGGSLSGSTERAAEARRAARAHSGAWADYLPRYHMGGEVPAMLEPGERVFSRQEVRNAGGPQQIDRIARGQGAGGSVTVVIAHDAKSFEERTSGDYGTAMVRSIRRNRGDFARELRRLGADL